MSGGHFFTFFEHFAETQLDPSWTPGHFFDIVLTFCRRPPEMTPKTFFGHFSANPGKPRLQRVWHIASMDGGASEVAYTHTPPDRGITK